MRGMLQGARSAGARVVADEPEVPAMMYTRDATAAPAIVEHMRFGLGDVPPGLHVVEVRIEDLVAKRTMSRQRECSRAGSAHAGASSAESSAGSAK